MRKLIIENVVEAFAASVMFAAGLVLLLQHGFLEDIGAAVMFASGIVFSWIATRAQASRSISRLLQAPVNTIGTAGGQISETLTQLEWQQLEVDAATRLIRRSNETVLGAMAEIQDAVGATFDPRAAIDTVEAVLDAVDEMAATRRSPAGDLDDATPTLPGPAAELVAQLRAQLLAAGRGEKRHERVECPACRQVGDIEIGTIRGDTIAHVCESCGQRFNVHRSSDGSIFTRQIDVNGLRPNRRVVACPRDATHSIPFTYDPDDPSHLTRYCLTRGCYVKVIISPVEPLVVSHEPSSPIEGSLLPRLGQQGAINIGCGACGTGNNRPLRTLGREAFAVCWKCGALNSVTLPDPDETDDLPRLTQAPVSDSEGTSDPSGATVVPAQSSTESGETTARSW